LINNGEFAAPDAPSQPNLTLLRSGEKNSE